MPVKLYMEVHVPGAITRQLMLRGVDALTAQADKSDQLPDDDLLDRATTLGRVLFSRDDDLLRIAAERQAAGTEFSGVIFAHQLQVSIGRCVQDLEFVAKACEPEDMRSRVEYLPL